MNIQCKTRKLTYNGITAHEIVRSLTQRVRYFNIKLWVQLCDIKPESQSLVYKPQICNCVNREYNGKTKVQIIIYQRNTALRVSLQNTGQAFFFRNTICRHISKNFKITILSFTIDLKTMKIAN